MPDNRKIFLVFLKIGTFAFGGVYSMLSFFQREIVDRRRWISSEEFAEGVAIGQMTPGPPIVNTGIYIGYRLRGLKGALAATLGQVLPGFMIIIALGYLYINHRSTPIFGSVLKGIGAAVVGLLLSVVYKMGNQILKSRMSIAITIVAFCLLYFLRFNAIGLIAASGFAGYLLYGRSR